MTDADDSATREGLARWHTVIETHGTDGLDDLLAEDVRFHSPVVFRPVEGKAMVTMYLAGADQVLNNGSFRYVRELVDAPNVLLEFETEVDGISVNGIDLIRFGSDGRIVDFKVMARPLKGFEKLREKMAELLTG